MSKPEQSIIKYESKVENATVIVEGEPNLKLWAKIHKKVYEDLNAGRYKKRGC